MTEGQTLTRHLPARWASSLSWALPLAAVLSGFLPRDRSRYALNPPFHNSVHDQFLDVIPAVLIPVGLVLGALCLAIWRKRLSRAFRLQAVAGVVLVALLGLLVLALRIFGEQARSDIIDFY